MQFFQPPYTSRSRLFRIAGSIFLDQSALSRMSSVPPPVVGTIYRVRRKHRLLFKRLPSDLSLVEAFRTDVLMLGLFLLPNDKVFVNIKAAGLTNIAAFVPVRIRPVTIFLGHVFV